MTEVNDYERGPMHAEHTKRFYWVLFFGSLTAGVIVGLIWGPDDWHIARSMVAGGLAGLLAAYSVFAWHWLVGPIDER